MRLGAIEGVHRRRRGKYGRRSISTATTLDQVERNSTAAGPNELWVADISYLRTWEGFLYLAVVVDAFSRKVVGWAMADHLPTDLVLDAVGMAITTRKPAAGTVHHTDRSTPYTSYEFGKRYAPRATGLDGTRRLRVRQRDGRVDVRHPEDRTDLPPLPAHPPRAGDGGLSYPEGFYNTRHRHSRLGNLSPTDYETIHLTQNDVSA